MLVSALNMIKRTSQEKERVLSELSNYPRSCSVKCAHPARSIASAGKWFDLCHTWPKQWVPQHISAEKDQFSLQQRSKLIAKEENVKRKS